MNGTRATTEEQGRAWPWIRSELETPWRQDADRPGRRELLPAAVLFAVLIAALYGRHVWRGAFLADDWLWLGWFHFLDGGLGSVHDMLSVKGPLLTSVRPGHTAWQSLVYLVGGDNRAAHLVAALTIAAVECFLLYCACRLAGLRILPSGCVAFLVAIFPFVDSTRLWFTGSEEAVATSFFLAGLCAALLGLRATGRGRQIAWQASAAVLYLAAISTYETFMAPLLLCGALYVLLIGRSALWRWLADLGVVLVGLLTAVRYARDKRGGNLDLSYLVDRTRQVSGDAVDAVGSAVPDVLLGPFGVALALLAVAGLVNLIRQGGDAAASIRSWAVVLGVGLVIALAGLVPLLPAQFAISPASEGFANRLLLPSAPGIALATVALCCLFAYGLAGLASRTRLAPPAALAALAALSVSLVRDEIRSQDRWAAIRPEQDRVIDAVREVAPTPGPFITAFVTLGHPTELPGGLASFSGAYDLDGALKLAYDSQYVGGRPLPPGSECGPDGLVFSPDILLADSAAVVLPYLLRFYLVNVNTGRGERIKDPARCRSFLATSGSEG